MHNVEKLLASEVRQWRDEMRAARAESERARDEGARRSRHREYLEARERWFDAQARLEEHRAAGEVRS